MKPKSPVYIILFLLVTAFAFLFPHSGLLPIPFAYCIPVLLLVWLVLKKTKESFSDLNFEFKRFEIRMVGICLVAAVFLFAFLQYLLFPVLYKILPLPPADLSDFKNIRYHFPNYIFILVMGWLVGGFYEELVFHGYIFTRLEKIMNGPYATSVAVLMANLVFALYHFQLGASGMINAFLAGCAYNILIVKFRRNLWYGIFFHGFFDSIALTFIYLGYW